MRRDQLIADGLSPEASVREARRRFGNPSSIAEDAAAARGLPRLESFARDLGFGWRMLRRSPSFAVAAVASLALAIAGAITAFVIGDALLLRQLPVRDPDSLVVLRWHSTNRAPFESLDGWGTQEESGLASTSFSPAAFAAMRRATAGRAQLFGFASLEGIHAVFGGSTEPVRAQVVSGNTAAALGLVPALGRSIDSDDDRPGAAPVVVLSHECWQRRFGADPAVLGRSIAVNGTSYAVVGVAPRGFHGTLQVEDRPELTFPLSAYGALTGSTPGPGSWYVLLMARIGAQERPEHLRAALDLVLKQVTAAAKPELSPAELPRLELVDGSRGQHESRDGIRDPFIALASILGLLLVVACANVASLQLARGAARHPEIATRLALGASRRRLVRQLLTEGLVLAGVGGALGLALAVLLGTALVPALVRGERIAVDLRYGGSTLVCCLLLVAGCAVAIGLAPALRLTAAGADVRSVGSRRVRRSQPLAAALVVTQVALTLALVSAGTRLVDSARRLAAVEPGFDTSHLLIADLEPPRSEPPTDREARYTEILERLGTLADAEGAALTDHRLLAGSSAIAVSMPAGAHPPPAGSAEERAFERSHRTRVLGVSDGFFRIYRMPILRGRALAAGDVEGAPRVAVVNQRLARQLFATDEVVGRSLRLDEDAAAYEIVGVAGDAHYTSLREEAPATLYTSLWQGTPRRVTVAVRTRRDPLDLASTVRRVVREADPSLAISRLGTQAGQARESMRRERVFAQLAAGLGAVTLLLSAIGLFGLLAYSVAQRTREIGVRMAIGAQPREVEAMVIGRSLKLLAGGLVLGLPAAFATGRVVESLLYGARGGEPGAYLLSAVLVFGVTWLAALLPARRAAAVDPLIAIRVDSV